MKHLIENWNKFINEEEIEEGYGTAALAAALGLGGGVKPNTQQNDTDTSSTTQTTQQVDAEKQAEGAIQKNADGSYTMEYSNPNAARGMSISLVKTFLKVPAIDAMTKKLDDAGIDSGAFNYSVEGASMANKSITLKATPK